MKLINIVLARASEGLSFNIICSNKDMDGTVLGVPVNEWVNYSNNTQVWYSADDNIVPVIKNEMAKQQDAVLYIVGIYDWVYNIKPLLFLKGVKKIISVRGMLHPGALTQKSFKKKAFLFLMKMWGWQRKVIFHVTDEGEREFVIRELGIRNEELGIRNWELGIGEEGRGIVNLPAGRKVWNQGLGRNGQASRIKYQESRIGNLQWGQQEE